MFRVLIHQVGLHLFKYIEFYSKYKLEKLVHLFGFIIRIYHDARSSEYQITREAVTNLLLHSKYGGN